MTVAELWDEHLRAPFPAGLRGKDVDGIDFVLLDAAIAGCVQTFLHRKRRLDSWRLAVLGIAYRDALFVRSHVPEDARPYIERLEALARAVLEEIRGNANPRTHGG